MKRPTHDRTVFRLLRYVGHYRLALIGALFSAILGNTALLLIPRRIGLAINLIGKADSGGIFVREMINVVVLIGVGASFLWLTSLLANLVANRTACRLRTDLFEKLGRLPVSYFDGHPRGDLMSRFANDIDAVSDGLSQGIVQLLSGFITVILCLLFMLLLDPRVTLVAVLVTPLCFLVGFFITRYGRRCFQEQSRVLGELNGYAEEMIAGQKTVKIFENQQETVTRFERTDQKLYEVGYRAQFASALVNPTTRFVNNSAYVLVGVFSIAAALDVGTIAAFLTYTAQYAKPFNEVTSITMQLQMAMASARRVFAVMDQPEQTPDALSDSNRPQGRVAFDHVCFSYRPERPLIHDFTLTVEPGTTVAIVGPTGAGKTTLVNLLMRFYELDSGRITIDGTDITTMSRDDLRRCFGMVLQETWLFRGTVRENIAYGKPDAGDEEIVAAAKAAHAHGFIRRLPQGYDTVIADDGGNLSQGQMQLLTIARAMLLDPAMLILDEATSSVDILTEKRIQKAFSTMMQGKTSFVIAHRLSTIRDADVILVLDRGNVVEQGTHEELLARNGVYRRLYEAQFAPTE